MLLCSGFETFKISYLKALINIYEALDKSEYKKVGWSMKLSIFKTIIMYFNLELLYNDEKNSYNVQQKDMI